MTELAVLIDDALRDPDPASGIARTKRLIRARLLDAEPGAEVRETDYFDHSFAPDLVLRPRGGKKGSERWVFLRTTNKPDELADDVEVAPKGGTLFVSLDRFRIPDGRREPLIALDRSSADRGSLVLDAPAFERVSDAETSRSSTALMTRALLTAGRGALGELEARQELATFAAGIEAAMAGDSETTRVAAEGVSRRLAGVEAKQVTSFLGALWEGGGRSLTEFPGRLGTDGLSAAGLAILLNGPEIPNDSFWQRIADRTSLADIVEAVQGATGNLQRLVKGGVDRIKVHVCLIERDEPDLFHNPMAVSWKWVVEQRCLGLRGPEFTAYVATTRDHLPLQQSARALVDLTGLRLRAQRFGITLREIRLRTPDRTVAYDSPAGEDIVGDHQLDQIGTALGHHSVVHVEAVIHGGQRLAVDFADGTAGMVAPRAQVPIRFLLGTAIRLLQPLEDSEADALRLLFEPMPSAPARTPLWEQPSLYDES